MTADDLAEAWAAVHDATPPGWFVGRPSYHDERREWAQYACDPAERAQVGVRSREYRDEVVGAVVRPVGSFWVVDTAVPIGMSDDEVQLALGVTDPARLNAAVGGYSAGGHQRP